MKPSRRVAPFGELPSTTLSINFCSGEGNRYQNVRPIKTTQGIAKYHHLNGLSNLLLNFCLDLFFTRRRKAAEYFRLRTYHRRELVESGNSSIKRKFGSSVSSKTVRTIRTEIYARLACHNLFGYITRLLGQSLHYQKLYKQPVFPLS